MPALRVCVRARTLCRTHGKLRYIMFIRTSRLAERLAPSRWSPRGQPLCAFAASCEECLKSPSLSSACAAMATMCSAGIAEALRKLGTMKARTVPVSLVGITCALVFPQGIVSVAFHLIVFYALCWHSRTLPRPKPKLRQQSWPPFPRWCLKPPVSVVSCAVCWSARRTCWRDGQKPGRASCTALGKWIRELFACACFVS
jgi:hypothetical protein